MQYETNKTDWQGQAHDFYAWDEITEFTESQFRYVIGWNRTTRRGQRTRVICTCNPPTTADGEWVLRFWAPWLDDTYPHPALPGELRWFTTEAGKDVEAPDGRPFVRVNGERIYEFDRTAFKVTDVLTPRSRTFIPAHVTDNPYLVESGYVATLQAYPEPLRSKMLYGDFRAGREDDAFQTIPTAWVMLAQERWNKRTPPVTPMSAIGVDVARGGKDATVLSPRFDDYFAEQISAPGTTTPNGRIVAALLVTHRKGNAHVNIDVIGVGSSPYDCACDAFGEENVTAMNASEGSIARDKSGKLGFVNKRAEWWWKFREALDPVNGEEIAIPPDPELRSDLCAPRWGIQGRGIKIEAKDEVAKRIGRSPDKGDALVYAHAEAEMTALDQLKRSVTW